MTLQAQAQFRAEQAYPLYNPSDIDQVNADREAFIAGYLARAEELPKAEKPPTHEPEEPLIQTVSDLDQLLKNIGSPEEIARQLREAFETFLPPKKP
jgi:hypothetical protein